MAFVSAVILGGAGHGGACGTGISRPTRIIIQPSPIQFIVIGSDYNSVPSCNHLMKSML
jgi:hypothetical protein